MSAKSYEQISQVIFSVYFIWKNIYFLREEEKMPFDWYTLPFFTEFLLTIKKNQVKAADLRCSLNTIL